MTKDTRVQKDKGARVAKELPILFTPEMAQKVWLREKWQTRRPVKGSPRDLSEYPAEAYDCNGKGHRSPFGQAGDVLYVRETFQGFAPHSKQWWHEFKGSMADRVCLNWDLFYRGEVDAGLDEEYELMKWAKIPLPRWIPSIHQPKWASRMKLMVKRVWVERVQDISDEGIIAEGCPEEYHPKNCMGMSHALWGWWEYLWMELYGRESWEENPFVWVCEFELMDGMGIKGSQAKVKVGAVDTS